MKFKLTTSGYHYHTKPMGLRQGITQLQELGFEFAADERNGVKILDSFWIKDKEVYIEFTTLEELNDFATEFGPVIMNGEGGIEIYDEYRE